MPIILRKQLGDAWEIIRGFLKDDLDQIEMELNLPVDLSEVEGTLPLSGLPELPPSTLLGRGSAGGPGTPEEIDLGPGLTMDGTTLRVSNSLLVGVGNRRATSTDDSGTRVARGATGPTGPVGPAAASVEPRYTGLCSPTAIRLNQNWYLTAAAMSSGSRYKRLR